MYSEVGEGYKHKVTETHKYTPKHIHTFKGHLTFSADPEKPVEPLQMETFEVPHVTRIDVWENLKANCIKVKVSVRYQGKLLVQVFDITQEALHKGDESIFDLVSKSMSEQMQLNNEKVRSLFVEDVRTRLASILWPTGSAATELSNALSAITSDKTLEYLKKYKEEVEWQEVGFATDFKFAVEDANVKFLQGGTVWTAGQHPYTWDFAGGGALSSEISRKSRELPGVKTVLQYPCDCMNTRWTDPEDPAAGVDSEPMKGELWNIVQHLNDTEKWSREKIADWIDDLHDRGIINAEFEPWGELDEDGGNDDNQA